MRRAKADARSDCYDRVPDLYTDVLLACTLATVLVIVLFAIPTVYMRVVGQQDSAKFTQVFNS